VSLSVEKKEISIERRVHDWLSLLIKQSGTATTVNPKLWSMWLGSKLTGQSRLNLHMGKKKRAKGKALLSTCSRYSLLESGRFKTRSCATSYSRNIEKILVLKLFFAHLLSTFDCLVPK
jgi:hypothetical protein